MPVAGGDDRRAALELRAERHAETHRHLGRHVDVDRAGDAVAREERAHAARLPHEVLADLRAGLDRLVRVDAHLGPDQGLLADDALVAERRALVDADARAQVAVAPDGRAAHGRVRADVRAAVDHRALHGRAGLDGDVGAEHGVRPDLGSVLDRRVGAEEGRPLDHVDRRQRHALAEPDVLLQAHAGHVDADEAVEHVLVRLAELLDRPDVLPVAMLGDDVAVERRALGEQLGEELLGEVVGLALRDAVEQLGLDHVHAGVDRVGEDLAPRRLLEEALDPALLVGDHDAELERVVDRLQRERRERAALAVERDDLAEIEVAERVARDHDERLGQVLARVLHRAGGAERLLLDRVLDAHAEGAAVPEVAADHLRHERERHHDVVDAVAMHELDDVLDARLAADRHHRLGLVRGQRTQARPLSSGHHDCAHQVPLLTSMRRRERTVPR